VHTPVAAFVTRFALRVVRTNAKPKVIYTAHGFHFFRGGPPLSNLIFLALEKLAGRWTDYLVVINEEDYNAAQKYRIVPERILQRMPGIGVDLEQYHPARIPPATVRKVRQDLKIADSDNLFLMVAEFIPRKCHADALRAFAKLDSKNLYLAFAGAGRLLKKMQELARELGIEEKVHFLGRRQDITRLIRASDVVILPSKQEGLPKCVLEAMSLEVPVIGTDIRGIGELLRNGAGILVSVGDVDALADAMLKIVNNPIVAKEMGRRGRMQVEQFSLKNVLDLHEELYEGILSSS
jgi:glycosyltransferase involved in cell wall biosynthesis